LIVAVEGAEFGSWAVEGDRDLVAVDLSRSGIKELPAFAFNRCVRLSAVAFPSGLVKVGWSCFECCDALQVVDLAGTQLREVGGEAFWHCGITRVSVPASLSKMASSAFCSTPLQVLDLSACACIDTSHCDDTALKELWLPREGFAAAAQALLPGSRIQILHANVGEGEVNELLQRLDVWGVDKLRIVSPRLRPYEWLGVPRQLPVRMKDPVKLSEASAVTMTTWRKIPETEVIFVRELDLSGLAIELPQEMAFFGFRWLERVILPAGLRTLPRFCFYRCWRLSSIDTAGTALETIDACACGRCRSLASFALPPTLRRLGFLAFAGTSITMLDLSETVAELADVIEMLFLVELVLPRGCVLMGVIGLPSLRRVTFGAFSGRKVAWHPKEVRFVSMSAHSKISPGLAGARVYGEVACEMGRETIPLPPR
jgi:hypothetical protein